jgi:uncharacterized protein
MNNAKVKNVVIVGASSNEDRYANMAQELLMEKGYPVIPVSLKETEILGVKTVPAIKDIHTMVDTVTLYVGSQRQQEVIRQILDLKPERVIFNPGTENPAAYEQLDKAGIDHEEACTLVLLRTRQF